MELKVFSNKSGKALYYMKSVRKPGKKNPTKEKVEFLGYEHELKEFYDDPIAHFRAEAKRLTLEAQELKTVNLSLNLSKEYPSTGGSSEVGSAVIDDLYYIGHLPLSRIYHELEIDQFVKNRRSKWGIKANVDTILRMLVFGRVLFPSSKLATWQVRERLMLGNSNVTENDMYRSFTFLNDYSEDLQLHIHKMTEKLYKRDSALMYYDVTNYYWEIDNTDADEYDEQGSLVSLGLRKRGYSKEHRPEPIVQMGLFIDQEGIPVSFGLFPGNNNDVTTFAPMVSRMHESYDLGKMIYIADKGIMSGTNIAHILASKQGYIISDKVRGQNSATTKWILDTEGYLVTTKRESSAKIHEEQMLMDYSNSLSQYDGDEHATEEIVDFMHKSRIIPSDEYAWIEDGSKKIKVKVNKKQIVFFSRTYQTRARIERCEAIKKAMNTGTVFNNHGANRFFTKEAYDPKTGELFTNQRHLRLLDTDLIAEAEKLDGFYIIETNVVGTDENEKPWKGRARFRTYDGLFELNKKVTDSDIISMYRGLWKIEESFKITKSHFKARPVFVRNKESIHAHFLTCFLALLIVRILEIKKLRGKMSHSELIQTLRVAKVGEIGSNIYKNYCSAPQLRSIGLSVGLNLARVHYRKQDLRAMNNQSKDV